MPTASAGDGCPRSYTSATTGSALLGVVLVTTATVFWLFLLPTTLRGETENPYIGILAFLVLPAPFFAGLVLIPLGIWLKHRREGRAGIYPATFPTPRWSNPDLRRLVYFFLFTTAINIAIASQLSYGAVNYMDSVTFCGQTCHTVMQPEYTAYQNSPHSRVECVKCHIGPGAGWFVKSKLSGVGQVFAVTFNTYPTPIPTPVHNLRPARETCEAMPLAAEVRRRPPEGDPQVRQRRSQQSDQDRAADEDRRRQQGHRNSRHASGPGRGHHLRPLRRSPAEHSLGAIRQARRQEPRSTPRRTPRPRGLTERDMDCMDCHNRPSHSYDLPERAVDRAMNAGQISAALPFAKKKAVEILKADYASREEAARASPKRSPSITGRATRPRGASTSAKSRLPPGNWWTSTTATFSPPCA